MIIKKSYSQTTLFVVLLYVSTMLAGCYPSSPDYIDDYDLVYTKEDKAFNFSSVQTYSLPDSVVHIATDPTKANHQYDARILQDLKQQLDALGWQQITNVTGNRADVVVLPSVTTQVNGICDMYCWWCYWNWWPGWTPYPYPWDPTWGWYYPTDLVCATYNTGSLIVTITNPNNAQNKQLPAVWLGVANGLLEGSTSDISSRIDKSIAQMFIQSPYLK